MKTWIKVSAVVSVALGAVVVWNWDFVKVGISIARHAPKIVANRVRNAPAVEAPPVLDGNPNKVGTPASPGATPAAAVAAGPVSTVSYSNGGVSPEMNRAIVQDRQDRLAAYLDERMRSQTTDALFAKKMTDQALNAISTLPFAKDLEWKGMECTDALCKVVIGFPSSEVQLQKEQLLRVIPSLSGGEAFVHRKNDTDEPTSVLYFSRAGKEFPWVIVGKK